MRTSGLKPVAGVVAKGNARNTVLYARVSSKEQEQGYSILAQQELLRGYASRIGLMIAQEFVDVESAKTTGRPGFVAMVCYLRQHGARGVVLVEKTDRLYRNLKDYVTMDDLGVEIHLVKENEILSSSSRSTQKFMHGIRVLMAKNYIDNLSEEVKKGLHTKAAQHLWPSFAPPGYRNTVNEAGRRIIVPDPVLGPIVRSLFEWFASGEYSLKSLARKAYEEGFRFRKSRNKLPVATLHKILRKRIYTGDFDYASVTYQGSHEPLVTREVWNRVQDILDGRQEKGCRKTRHAFVYSGTVTCGHCGCSLVGEVKKRRYVYYHCTGYRGKCGEPYTREETLTRQFAGGLRQLILSPAIVQWLTKELVESEKAEWQAPVQALRRDQAELDRARARLDMMYGDRLDGRIDAETYDRRAKQVREQQLRIEERMGSAELTTLPSMSRAIDLMVRTSKAAQEFTESSGEQQRKLLRLVLKEATWTGGELRMSLQEPFEKFRLSNSASTTKHDALGAKGADFGIWRRGGDSNPR